MRIIINVKYRQGKVILDTRLDGSSTDKVSEMNAGKALYDRLNAMFAELDGGQKKEVE